ncbi:hypothetical protein [Geopseudomonas aromaticivorans]
MSDIVKRLLIKAGMMEMGERIAWGSDTALMREAAAKIEALTAERNALQARLDEIAERERQLARYASEEKGGEYLLLGQSKGAGPRRGERLMVYRSCANQELYHRTPENFGERMRRLNCGDKPIEAYTAGERLTAIGAGPAVFQPGIPTYLQSSQDRELAYWFLTNQREGDIPAYFIEIPPSPLGVLQALAHVGGHSWVDKAQLLAALLPAIEALAGPGLETPTEGTN